MTIEIAPDDEQDVVLNYDVEQVPFQRIRRITGYLVGTLDRWNNAKRAEEHDRVKHGVE
jgi:anaerobic ribonucleoside-triphosphate reductase